VAQRTSSLLKFHTLLKQRKYRLLYSSAGNKRKPGPQGPSQVLIQAIVELKQRNPRFGCPRIAQQINKAFGVNIDKDVVRRILATPFVERLIGTVRREYLDQTLFWNASDLERKLEHFRQYYNLHRAHTAHDGNTPLEISSETTKHSADLGNFHWKSHCRGLYQLPVAA
jgi:hypothetical protein